MNSFHGACRENNLGHQSITQGRIHGKVVLDSQEVHRRFGEGKRNKRKMVWSLLKSEENGMVVVKVRDRSRIKGIVHLYRQTPESGIRTRDRHERQNH